MEILKAKYTQAGKRKNFKFAGVEIEGLEELVEAFNKLGEDAVFKLGPASIEGANIIAEKAKTKVNNIPDNKDLRNNIKVRKPGRKPKKKYQVFANVYLKGGRNGGQYGVPLELGHKLVYMGYKTNTHVAERPFLRPAADESKDEVRDIIAKAMNEIIDEMGGMR